jgi:hypothetical protein
MKLTPKNANCFYTDLENSYINLAGVQYIIIYTKRNKS